MTTITVSVVYASADGALFSQSIQVPSDTQIGEAIGQSDFLKAHPHMSLETLSVGVYSLRKRLEDGLHDKDRIEIYRPLMIDPKDRRRKAVDEKRDPAKWRRER
ncbi:RnfH family protein [Hydromonas duriensis]|nr:RnfH family protein [Hydromonas duriensis]